MRTIALTFVLSMSACTPSSAPPPDEPSPVAPAPDATPPPEPQPPEPQPVAADPLPADEPEWPCAADSDCVLATRASLGCCDPCPIVEAMSVAQRDEIANLCGLHNGSERCPPMERVDCPPEESIPSPPVCREGVCQRGP